MRAALRHLLAAGDTVAARSLAETVLQPETIRGSTASCRDGPCAGGFLELDNTLIHKSGLLSAQRPTPIRWLPGGSGYTVIESDGSICRCDAISGAKTTLVSAAQLTPPGSDRPLRVGNYQVGQAFAHALRRSRVRLLAASDSRSGFVCRCSGATTASSY